MLVGVVESIVFKGVHYEMNIDVDGFKYLVQSTLSKNVGDKIGMIITPENIHIMRKVM